MGRLLRHVTCMSLIAACEKPAPCIESRYWLILTPDDRMVRPAMYSTESAFCPDCRRFVFLHYRQIAPFETA